MAAAAAPALASSAADAPASAVLGTSLALSATREVSTATSTHPRTHARRRAASCWPIHAHARTRASSSSPMRACSQVRMVIVGRCKMGISFWPSFRFSAPDREPQAGSVSVVHAAGQQQQQPRDDDDSGAARAVASGDAPTGAGAAAHAAAEAPAAAAGGEAAAHTAQVLHVDFPPDEVQLGARFLGCLPFPFLAMRTTRLAVSWRLARARTHPAIATSAAQPQAAVFAASV